MKYKRYKFGSSNYNAIISSIWLFILLLLLTIVQCSEFPERECCDPPQIESPDSESNTISVVESPIEPIIPSHLTTTASSIGQSGQNVKTAAAILNCILARQLCFDDASCSAILEIIPRVCGPIPVACSTVTVTKCQAALRTLQAFQFFRPTCLCKEPGVDPDCNYFRDFLFDHPCGFVLKKEKDPFPIDALPTCNHALFICQQDRKCKLLFEDFKQHCKVRDNKCKMDDRNLCHESWTNLRLSPMFGCICPNNHMKKRCDKIFSVVNHNPCVDELPSSLDESAGTATNSVYPIFPSEFDEAPPKKFPYTFPYFLYPSHKIPITLASQLPYEVYTFNNYSSIHVDDIEEHNFLHNHHKHNNMHNYHQSPEHNNNDSESSSLHHNKLHTNSTFSSTIPSPPYDQKWHRTVYQLARAKIVRAMGMEDIYHKLLDTNMALVVDTPLIAPSNSYYPHHYKTALYPYNLTTNMSILYNNNESIGSFEDNTAATGLEYNKQQIGGSDESDEPPDTDIVDIINFQSTCHLALESCKNNSKCSSSLQPVLHHCDLNRCNRPVCMEKIQSFYRRAHESFTSDVAFCLCRKTDNWRDSCKIAQEKLHPHCAEKPDEEMMKQNPNNGIGFSTPPACHLVAEHCRNNPLCRDQLESYEQSCAIDSLTKKCATKPSICRSALIGILGTSLRTVCACQGTELSQLYECLGWQRLLWLNPCVVEAQKEFHMIRLEELGLLVTTTTRRPTTTTTTTTTTTAATTTKFTTTTIRIRPTTTMRQTTLRRTAPPIVIHYRPTQKIIESNVIEMSEPLETSKQSENEMPGIDSPSNEIAVDTNDILDTPDDFDGDTEPPQPTSTIMSTMEMTTRPPKFCTVQRPGGDQKIEEGKSRRLYLNDDVECSELCTCSESLSLSCHALCVPLAPCRTSLAYYSHAAPAYQAYRGRCLCYSGRFICMRPPPGEYTLPSGVFLLLGYSSTDEALLRPHTNLGIQDAVRALQHYIVRHVDNQTSCTLTLFNMTDENIILSARLPHDSKANVQSLLKQEKVLCKPVMETVSHHINSQYIELSAHRLLSIFKMAEVQVVIHQTSAAISSMLYSTNTIMFLSIILYPFMRWFIEAHAVCAIT